MSVTSNCPRCQKQVTVPNEAAAETIVRCPLCSAEYPLSEALALMPPVLIIVSPVAIPAVQPAAAPVPGVGRAQPGEVPLEPWDMVEAEADHGDGQAAVAAGGGEADAFALAEEEVDFAAITGRAPPAGAAEGAAVAVPAAPLKRRRRRREATPLGLFIRFVGMAIAGALGLGTAYLIGSYFKEDIDNGKYGLHLFHNPPNGNGEEQDTTAPQTPAAGKPEAKAKVAPAPAVDTAKPQAVEKPPVEKPAPPATPPTAKTPPPKVLAKAPMEVEESPDAPERPEAEPRDPLASTAGKMGPLVPSEAEFQPVRVGPVKKEPEPPAKVQPDIKAQPDIKVEPPAKVEAKIEPPGKPEPKAEAPVKPESPAVEPPGPHGAPAIGATDLKKALQDAKDVCEAKPWDQLGDDGCEKLRQLAEIATPLKGHPGDQDLQPALELLGRAAASPPALKRVTESAQKMLQDAAKAQGGILLAGTVTKLAEKGGLVGIVFTTDASPAPVMVLADRNPGVKEGERALLAGRIVNDPAKNLPGYTGRKPYVIWVGMACKLP